MLRLALYFSVIFLSNLGFANQGIEELSAKKHLLQGLLGDVFTDLLSKEINFDVQVRGDETSNMSGVINLSNKIRCKNFDYTFYKNGMAFKIKVSEDDSEDLYETVIGILFHEGQIYSGFLDEEKTEDVDLDELLDQTRVWEFTEIKEDQSLRFQRINEPENYLELRKTILGYSLEGTISQSKINGKFQFTISAIHTKRYEALKSLFEKGKKVKLPARNKIVKIKLFSSFATENCDLSFLFIDDEILGKKVAYLTINRKEYESLQQGGLVEKFSNNDMGASFELELAENMLPDGTKVLVYRLSSPQGDKFFYEKIPSV